MQKVLNSTEKVLDSYPLKHFLMVKSFTEQTKDFSLLKITDTCFLMKVHTPLALMKLFQLN